MHNDTPASTSSRFSFPELALIGITFLWGATFLIVQHAVAVAGPLAFVGALFCYRLLRGITRAEIGAGTDADFPH
jgi:hypothetical protein